MKIIVYTTPSCPYCVLVKNFLNEKKIKFEEIDISKNEKRRDEMIKKSGQKGVPVIDIGGTIIIGYDVGNLKKYLKIK